MHLTRLPISVAMVVVHETPKGRAMPGRPSDRRVGIRPTSGAIAAGRPARWAHRCDARRTARGHRPQGPPVDLPRWLASRLDEGQARELVRARGWRFDRR